jgi:hypothetical protein
MIIRRNLTHARVPATTVCSNHDCVWRGPRDAWPLGRRVRKFILISCFIVCVCGAIYTAACCYAIRQIAGMVPGYLGIHPSNLRVHWPKISVSDYKIIFYSNVELTFVPSSGLPQHGELIGKWSLPDNTTDLSLRSMITGRRLTIGCTGARDDRLFEPRLQLARSP